MTPTRRYSPVEWGALVVAAVAIGFGVTMMAAWFAEKGLKTRASVLPPPTS